ERGLVGPRAPDALGLGAHARDLSLEIVDLLHQGRGPAGQEAHGHDRVLDRERPEHGAGRAEEERGQPLVAEGPVREAEREAHAALRERQEAAPARAWLAGPRSSPPSGPQGSRTSGMTPSGSARSAIASSGGRAAERTTAAPRPVPCSRSR